jgi:hypothetical protein
MHDELHGTGVAPHAEGADADQGGDTTTSVAPDSAVLKSAGE